MPKNPNLPTSLITNCPEITALHAVCVDGSLLQQKKARLLLPFKKPKKHPFCQAVCKDLAFHKLTWFDLAETFRAA
jgi:hypothetical protein